MEGSRELPGMSDNDSSVGIGFLENTEPILLPIFPPVITRLLISWATMIVRLLVFKPTVDVGKVRRYKAT